MNFHISQLEDWQEVVEKILPHLYHRILLLKGNLGAGKTTFTQYLLKNLGSSNEVNSPTYSIVNEYDCPKGKIYHFDLYRLSIIEWPEIYQTELEGIPYHEMQIENQEDGRKIVFI
jgi:tRNA threonylcarbamoyladenosine biosynthesis protein TsaE